MCRIPYGLRGVALVLCFLAAGMPGAATGVWAQGRVPPERSIDREYRRTAWTTEDGLPQNSVNDIVQTRDGYLWLATFGGLVRFDGITFTVFDVASTPALPGNRLVSLFEDRAGTLWIGHESGEVTAYRDGAFTTYTAADGLPGRTVWAFAEDTAGHLWIATWQGVVRYADGAFTTFSTDEGLPHARVYSLQVDRDGQLWAGTAGGLARYEEGRFIDYAGVAGTPSGRVGALYTGADGRLWAGGEGGLVSYHEGRFTAVPQEVFPIRGFSDILIDRSGTLWGGGGTGTPAGEALAVLRFEEAGETPARARVQPMEAHVEALFEDREGNLWVGTDGGGLHRFREKPVTRYTIDDGLAHNSVFRVTGDGEGGVWLTAGCANLTHFRDGIFTTYPLGPDDGLLGCIWAMLRDRTGVLWLGSGEDLVRREEGRMARYTVADGLPGGDIVSLFEDRTGVLWVGSSEGGVARFDGEDFRVYTPADGLAHGDVRFIMQARDGAMWFGTRQGLSRLQDGRFITYTAADGLAPGSVRAVYEDADGVFWVGTYGGGLSRLKAGRLTRYTTQDGLFDNVVSRILEDARGNLWMLGNQGLFFVNRQALNDFADGRRSTLDCVSLGSEAGMAEGNGGGQPAGWQTEDGVLYFPTIAGLAVVDPRAFHINAVPPPVVIERLVVDARAFDLRQAVVAPPGPRNIEILYTGLSFSVPEKVRFRYRLDGHDAAWQDAADRRRAFYTNLAPGSYTFRVQAANNDGVWNETGASLSVVLRPFFYETTWFYAVCVLLLLLAGYTFYQVRTRSIRAHNLRLHAEIVERQRVEDALRASEAKFATVFHAAPVPMIVVALHDNRCLDVNPYALTLFGYEREEVVGKSMDTLNVWKDLDERAAILEQVRAEGAVREQEVQFQARPGVVRDLLIFFQAIEVGGEPCVLGMAHDVTERKRASEEREQLIAELEAQNAELERFTYTVSHDLKTPLVTIKGFLGLLRRGLASGHEERVEHDIAQINSAANKMGRLLDDLLELSRIGRTIKPPEPVALAELATEAVELAAGSIMEQGVLVEIDTSMPMVQGDRVRLLEVYQNLIDNAIKFRGEQEAPRIEIGAQQGAEAVRCHVRDNGMGIDPKYQEKIFGLFNRLDSAVKGTGVGLALVQRIIEVHGGRIWVESEGLGQGCTFYFTLPYPDDA